MQFVDQLFWIAAIAGSAFMALLALTGFVGHTVFDGSGHHAGDGSGTHTAGDTGQVDGGAHHAHGSTGSFDWGRLPGVLYGCLSPTFLAMSLAFFGFAGVLFRALGSGVEGSLWFAAAAGLCLAVLTSRSVAALISKGGESSHVVTRQLVGQVAEVTTSIPLNGYGEITVYVSGSGLSFPARSAESVELGRRVFVERIENGVATVSKYDE